MSNDGIMWQESVDRGWNEKDTYMYMCIFMYIYIYTHINVHTYMYILPHIITTNKAYDMHPK